MTLFKKVLLCFSVTLLLNCASGYEIIAPKSINYISKIETENVKLEYKYNLLDKKYAKKELKKGVKLVAVKISNNTTRDLVFGKDIKLTYLNGSEAFVMENETVFKTLKQSTASYLFYLLLTPMNLYTYKTNNYGVQETNSSTPIGLIIGPGLAGGNMIAAGSANKKFESELLNYNLNGTIIKKEEVKYGLIGIRTNSFESLKLKVE
ncbi:hypothetical protein [Snuella sedimenti]|uniref:Uncharacterized protein n=1 Tax=Snuella sedimenti TaxID=2798802 RepID=A0A8J7IG84_9FLAO|nr:hypothetical protein [Snuella sedimenti]MBJ6368852.1 hypothetical protein [Snuella sedimenti]